MKPFICALLLTIAGSIAAEELPFAQTNDVHTTHAYLITTSASFNATTVHIINRTDTEVLVAGTLYDGAGNQLGNAATALSETGVSPRARLMLTAGDIEGILNIAPWDGPALLEVRSNGEIDIMTELSNQSGIFSSTNCVTTGISYKVKPGMGGDESFIRVINQGTKPITNITGRLVQRDGRDVGTTSALLSTQLAPKAAIWLVGSHLEQKFDGEWDHEATLIVDADDATDLRLMNLHRSGQTFVNYSCHVQATKPPATLTACTDPRPQACTQQHDPVCAQRDNGIRCVTTPCPSIEWETYSNACIACSDPLVFGSYPGSCETRLLTE